jgi:hypothetical protein
MLRFAIYIATPKMPHGIRVILKKFFLCPSIFFSLRTEVLMEMSAKIADFWHMTHCSLIEI